MTGRGIDQVLPSPCPPRLYEPYIQSAEDYIALAEHANGPIPRPAAVSYPWGDALDELRAIAPDARIVNLETAITRSESAWGEKGIHYRMSPENAQLLAAADVDCCALANNHVLDWGNRGLEETLQTLDALGVRYAGAGPTWDDALKPAVIAVGAPSRVLVYSVASISSGVPRAWTASDTRAGVALLADLSSASLDLIAERVRTEKRPGDLVVVSVHWGRNWEFEVSTEERDFAHGLVDEAAVDLVHGHSSHHIKGIEVHAGRLILYGCGDFLNDYEGIEGYDAFRDDLGLMYFATLDRETGRLARLRMTPTRIKRFRVHRAAPDEIQWLADTLNREGARFGTSVAQTPEARLELRW